MMKKGTYNRLKSPRKQENISSRKGVSRSQSMPRQQQSVSRRQVGAAPLLDRPSISPALLSQSYPYGYVYPPAGYTNNLQLGLVTEHMLRKLDESRLLTMTELMRRSCAWPLVAPLTDVSSPILTQTPGYSQTRQQQLNANDWQDQLNYIHGKLIEIAKGDADFRRSVSNTKFGEILSADLEENAQCYTMSITFEKHKHAVKRSVGVVKDVGEKESGKSKAPFEREHTKQEGTVTSVSVFSAERDSETLRKAMKGLGTDEDTIIEIVGRRSNSQRQQICRRYATLFGRQLTRDLASELNGDFGHLVTSLCLPPADFDATTLRDAIQGIGTDEHTLVEIVCTRNNRSLRLIIEAYKRIFGRKLTADITRDASGDFRNLLVSLLQANRDESDHVDNRLARKDAKRLLEAGSESWGTDESRFNAILVSRSYGQLRATFRHYGSISGGATIDEAIEAETSGPLRDGLKAIVACVANTAKFFAGRLYDSMQGLGTDETALTRVVVSRCEIDMVQVKEEFQENFKQPISRFIADDTSGHYRKLLLTLIGEKQSPPSE